MADHGDSRCPVLRHCCLHGRENLRCSRCLCIHEAIMDLDVRGDPGEQRRIEGGQEEVGIGDEGQTFISQSEAIVMLK